MPVAASVDIKSNEIHDENGKNMTYGSVEYIDAAAYEDEYDDVDSGFGMSKGVWAGIATMLLFFVYLALQLNVMLDREFIPVPDLIRVSTLDPTVMPESKHHHPAIPEKDRMILIGDVHGNLKQLHKLLKKVSFDPQDDQLVLLGDMISKGPDSIGVLDYAISVNSSCVRGNHEDNVLRAYTNVRRLPSPKVEPVSDYELLRNVPLAKVFDDEDDDDEDDGGDDDEDDPQEPDDGGSAEYNLLDGKRWKADEEMIARKLRPQHIEFLGSCSLILDLGRVAPNNTRAVALHAGLQWNIKKLYRQRPLNVMTMRFMSGKKHKKAEEDKTGKKSVQWSKIWNKKQLLKPLKRRISVFYGHDARHGLNIRNYSYGLDSNCIGGDHLSAMVITKDKTGNLTHEIVQVPC